METRELELLEIESSQRQSFETMLYNIKRDVAVKEADMVNFKMLSPKVCKEGNQWCVWYGESFREANLIGFGKTVYKAIQDFNNSFNKEIPNVK